MFTPNVFNGLTHPIGTNLLFALPVAFVSADEESYPILVPWIVSSHSFKVFMVSVTFCCFAAVIPY